MKVTKTVTLTIPVAKALEQEDNQSKAVDEALRTRYNLNE
jgi:hypothetical protein